MSDVIIRVENVSKEYRLGAIGGTTLRDDLQRLGARLRGKEDPTMQIGQNEKHNEKFLALDHVSFHVNKGEALGVIGHNGAGKSTLLKLLSRVTAPTTGKISYNGRIASMLEVGTGFHPELTGRENIYMNGAILGMSKAEIDQKIDQIIAFAEMEKFVDTPVKRYSSGMYVKLAFAVAAHLDSEIMVMDEVLAVGDMKFQQKCLGKMENAANQEGKTVLYVSHNMNTIRQLCTRCIVLDHGKVVFDGDVERAIQIYEDIKDDNIAYLDCKEISRPKWLVRDNARIQYAGFCNSEGTFVEQSAFEGEEKVYIRLGIQYNRPIENLGLRIEFKNRSGTVVATSVVPFLKTDYSRQIQDFVFAYDFGLFAPEKLVMNLILFANNEFGTCQNIDWVSGLSVTMKSNARQMNLEWDVAHWGCIQVALPSVTEYIESSCAGGL